MLKKFFNRLIVITILGSQLSTFSYAAPKDFDANKLDLPSSKKVMPRRPWTPWTAEEDKMLDSLVESSAPNTDWKFVASKIKNHDVRSCKERYKWISDIWTQSDEKLLMDLVDKFGFALLSKIGYM